MATAPFVRNVPQTFHARTLSRVDLYISFFYLRYLLTYYPFYIKRMPRASQSLHFIDPVTGVFIYIMRKSKVLDANVHSYVRSVAAVETSGISIVVE
jgi:hypothetical protein